MNDWVIPVSVLGSYFGGALFLMVYKWLTSGERFNWRKFSASLILTIIISLQGGISMVNSDIILNTPALISYCVTAVLAGFGTVKLTSEVAQLNQGKPEKGGTDDAPVA